MRMARFHCVKERGMKKILTLTTGLLALIGFCRFGHAEDSRIEQVSPIPAPAAPSANETALKRRLPANGEENTDYQTQVLSNPYMSDIARARSMTGGGGNTAIINQEGASNSSSVVQSGKNNYSRQTQKGKANDIYLNQQGDNNRSDESQIGEYNHKVIIQNDNEEETTEEE